MFLGFVEGVGSLGDEAAWRRDGFLPDVCAETAEHRVGRPSGAAVANVMIWYFCCCRKERGSIVPGDAGQMNQLLWHLEASGKCQGQQRREVGHPTWSWEEAGSGGREEQDGAEEPAFPGSRALLGPRSTLEELHFVVCAGLETRIWLCSIAGGGQVTGGGTMPWEDKYFPLLASKDEQIKD